MKVTVNLATLASRRERYAFAWSIPLALAALAVLVALIYSTFLNYREYHKIDNSLDTLKREEQGLKNQDEALRKDLDQPRYREMFQKAHYVNDLIDQKQLSMADIVERVSKLLPSSVRLTSLNVSQSKKGIAVRFSVLGKDEDALETLMGNLEDAPDFQDLTVANQSSGTQAASLANGLVGLVCSAQYVGQPPK